MKTIKRYSELILLPTFEERFEYLKLKGSVGVETFGFNRYLNQALYNSHEWKSFRRKIILRDSFKDHACDLGIADRAIGGIVILHHINSLTEEDILNRDPKIFDEENIISCSLNTHNAIHYGDSSLLIKEPIMRFPNDTCPWR